MYNWKLVPTKSIGDINFGMNRSEVRALFSGAFEEFKKTEDSDETTDDFGDFHVYYDEDDKVEAVEIFENVNVEYEGKTIFPIAVGDIIKIFEDIEVEEEFLTDYEKSIGYSLDEDEVECVLFGNEGYYD